MIENKNIQIKNYENKVFHDIEVQRKKTNSPTINVSQFAGMQKPTVLKILPIEKALKIIQGGDENISQILKARAYGKGSELYDKIKTFSLPTFRFNFLFDSYATNNNIVAPTGLIYLDADYIDAIPDNEYVFAKWKSLSDKGFGILVKVQNLSKTNHKRVYNELSEIIGIKSDLGACKANQQTVLSYDNNLYFNPNSLTYKYIEKEEVKKVSFSNIKKEKKVISSNDTFLWDGDKAHYRNNNINDYFKGEFIDVPFLVFSDEKAQICQPFIPFNIIGEGQRNWRMLSFLSMHASLNPNCDKQYLIEMSNYMNNRMNPKLLRFEVATIIRKVLKKKEEGSLEMYCNKERRILFNPNMNFTREERFKIIGGELGKVRRTKKSLLIYQTIENWDFEVDGKIIQKKVAKKANQSIATIKRYWHEFKNYVEDLNNSYAISKKPS